MSDFGLLLVAQHPPVQTAEPHVNLVFVHGLGSKADEAWYHPVTGKTWIQDADFLSQLIGPVRVWTFTFNSDMPANLSPACIAFHADDLLYFLTNVLEDGNRGPVIFIAHSWGGVIVKKALQLCWQAGRFPMIKPLTRGLVFAGTPHAHDKPEALRKALWRTIQTFHTEDTPIDDSQIREYIAAVGKVNRFFINMPARPKVLSLWEEDAADTDQQRACLDEVIVPQDCHVHNMTQSEEETLQCGHADLLRFPDIYNKDFMTLKGRLNFLLSEALRFSAILPPLKKPPALLDGAKVAPPPSEKPPDPPHTVPTSPVLSDKPSDRYHYWTRKAQAEDRKASRAAFLGSLKGWTEANIGNHISPAPGTCLWATIEPDILDWYDSPLVNRLFLIASSGMGKTYLLRALQEQIQVARPKASVLSFFCSPGTGRPPIWEYFTSEILRKEPWLFTEMPSRYRGKCETPDLGLGSFVDIWHAFLEARPTNSIWLLVDGLEQCGEEHFENFLASYKELFARPLLPRGPPPVSRGNQLKEPTSLKIIFTCRATPAVINAQASAPRHFLDSKNTAKDISAYIDLKLDPLVNANMESDRVKDLKGRIKDFSLSYWPFAAHAVQDAQRDLAFASKTALNDEENMPRSLQQWYREKVLPKFQSVICSWLVRTTLNICVSQIYDIFLTVQQLNSALKCLSHGEHRSQADLVHALMTDLGDILVVRPDRSMRFVHPSMAWYIRQLLSPEQRHANMASLCLQYLLHDDFKRPLEIEKRGTTPVERERWLDGVHPFYDYAGSEWAFHLKESKELADRLLPLVKEFVDEPHVQTKTWIEWRLAMSDDSTRVVDPGPQAIVSLVHEGCTNVLERLIPPQKSVPWYSREKITAWATQFSSQPWMALRTNAPRAYSNVIETLNWPETTDRKGQTALMGAVISDCIDTVQFVLRFNPHLEALSDPGETALMCSLPALDDDEVTAYDCAILELLLEKGANPNTCNRLNWTTALHLSCIAGLPQPTELLLGHSALVDLPDFEGMTPLECAYISKDVTLVQELLDAGADPGFWWRGAQTALNRCIYDGKLPMFRALLEVADVNQIGRSGLAPVHAACEGPGRLEFLKLVLERPEVDVNMSIQTFWGFARRPDGELLTPISMAAKRGDYLSVELLLQAGADAGTVSDVEYSPLHHAAFCRSASLARLLLEHNAPVNAVCRQRAIQTPLGIAVSNQDEDMVALLLQYGADPTVDEGYGGGSLLLAVALRAKDPKASMIKKLLEARVTPTLNPSKRLIDHPLILATQTGNIELVRLLLDHGADLRIWLEPADWVSPLHVAAAEGHREIGELLLSREPQLLNAHSEHGYQCRSPLHVACKKKKPDMVQFLLKKGALADSLAYHDQESCLLMSCGVGDRDSVEALLKAAPEMIDKPSAQGETPLSRACTQEDLKIIEVLLEAGADIKRMDYYGTSCISPKFFDRANGPVDKKLELLIKHGLDINAVVTNRGLTVLGLAIQHGRPNDTKWLIDHGADLSRCQRSPLEPITWRNALQVACHSGRMNQVRLILETDWMSPEALRGRDWLGGGVLPPGPPRAWTVEITREIYWVCEEEKNNTGDDLFAELISQPCINGLTPVDWTLHTAGCTVPARRQLDDRIRHCLEELLPRPRNRDTQAGAVEEVARMLLYRGGSDEDAEFLLSLALSVPYASWDLSRGRYLHYAILACPCHICMRHDCGIAWICASCMTLCCDLCFAFKGAEPLHRHDWVEIRLFGWGWNSDEVQDRLEELSRRFGRSDADGLSPIEEEPECFPGYEARLSQDTTDSQLQTSLQLATLHAFNLLAIRRPLFTPYLPLSIAVEATIAPWAALIQDQRRTVEIASLMLETFPTRLASERSYITRGLLNRYADEDDVRLGNVLQGIQGLYEEKPVPRKKQIDVPFEVVEIDDLNDENDDTKGKRKDGAWAGGKTVDGDSVL